MLFGDSAGLSPVLLRLYKMEFVHVTLKTFNDGHICLDVQLSAQLADNCLLPFRRGAVHDTMALHHFVVDQPLKHRLCHIILS